MSWLRKISDCLLLLQLPVPMCQCVMSECCTTKAEASDNTVDTRLVKTSCLNQGVCDKHAQPGTKRAHAITITRRRTRRFMGRLSTIKADSTVMPNKFELMTAQDSKHFKDGACQRVSHLLLLLSECQEVRDGCGCLWVVDLIAGQTHELLLELLMRTQCSESDVPFGGGARSGSPR